MQFSFVLFSSRNGRGGGPCPVTWLTLDRNLFLWDGLAPVALLPRRRRWGRRGNVRAPKGRKVVLGWHKRTVIRDIRGDPLSETPCSPRSFAGNFGVIRSDYQLSGITRTWCIRRSVASCTNLSRSPRLVGRRSPLFLNSLHTWKIHKLDVPCKEIKIEEIPGSYYTHNRNLLPKRNYHTVQERNIIMYIKEVYGILLLYSEFM